MKLFGEIAFIVLGVVFYGCASTALVYATGEFVSWYAAPVVAFLWIVVSIYVVERPA